jgi:hypothetical protein
MNMLLFNTGLIFIKLGTVKFFQLIFMQEMYERNGYHSWKIKQ